MSCYETVDKQYVKESISINFNRTFHDFKSLCLIYVLIYYINLEYLVTLIYIIEDDDNVREIEEYALVNAGYQTKSFSSAENFYKTINIQLPDLCIIDIMLPGENGNEIVRKLRKKYNSKEIPIIMVTARTADVDLVKSVEAGADDYIKKPFSILELIYRVKAILRRVPKQAEQILIIDSLEINKEKHKVYLNSISIDLTFKEYELLSLLVSNKGKVLDRNTIMNQVWGICCELESRTIDVHVKTLRHKLGDFGNRIKTVRNVGYVIE